MGVARVGQMCTLEVTVFRGRASRAAYLRSLRRPNVASIVMGAILCRASRVPASASAHSELYPTSVSPKPLGKPPATACFEDPRGPDSSSGRLCVTFLLLAVHVVLNDGLATRMASCPRFHCCVSVRRQHLLLNGRRDDPVALPLA